VGGNAPLANVLAIAAKAKLKASLKVNI